MSPSRLRGRGSGIEEVRRLSVDRFAAGRLDAVRVRLDGDQIAAFDVRPLACASVWRGTSGTRSHRLRTAFGSIRAPRAASLHSGHVHIDGLRAWDTIPPLLAIETEQHAVRVMAGLAGLRLVRVARLAEEQQDARRILVVDDHAAVIVAAIVVAPTHCPAVAWIARTIVFVVAHPVVGTRFPQLRMRRNGECDRGRGNRCDNRNILHFKGPSLGHKACWDN